MANRPRVGSRGSTAAWTASPEVISTEFWPEVDAEALDPERRATYLLRRQAILMYLEGATDAELKSATGQSRTNVYRLVIDRCLRQHPDGTLIGWRGALAYLRLAQYHRHTAPRVHDNGAGAVGALQWLFVGPGGAELEARFRKHILGKTPALASSRRPKQELFAWFIRELRAAGHEARGQWPFNVEKMGYVTISKFIDRVMDSDPRRQRQILGGKDAERKARAGDGTRRPSLRLFERVECDAHKLDARMIVLVPSPHGGHEPRKIHRLWVVVIMEVASRAVLGYHLSLHRECGAEDVLRAIKRALTLWHPRELQFGNHAYAAQACLPSARTERYLGACWDEFSVDGALANVCARVERQLREVVGSTILKPQDPHSYASRRSKDDRPFIESFFRELAGGGFHRLSATTGSSPQDKQGRDPDAAAAATQFQLEYAEELLDTLVANHNARPHSGLGYRSPLEQMDFLSAHEPASIRQADAGAVRRMVGIRKLCTVKGGIHSGRRPYFNFENTRYSAEWLCLRTDLLGKNCWLHLEDEDDARLATVSTQKGEVLGVVRAAPPWHRTPHTLYMRQAIRAMSRRHLLHLTSNCDAVEELVRFCEASADRKLPAHPAYLEARRVLQLHAERLKLDPRVPATGPALPAASPVEPAPGAEATGTEPPAAQPARKLPPMHMAKTW